MIKVLLNNNKELPYIIKTTNNKNTYIRFKKEYVEVSKSKHIKDSDVIKLLNSNFDKYYNKFNRLLTNTPEELEIILEEKKYKMILVNKRTFSFQIVNDSIIINTTKSDILDIKKQVYLEYLKHMISRISNNINEALVRNNLLTKEIKFGYFKTKFGSYHRISDIIKLNIVLAKANINYLYYVIMHEYAHTKEFNHGKGFYKLLEQLMPNYKFYDKNIKSLSIWL